MKGQKIKHRTIELTIQIRQYKNKKNKTTFSKSVNLPYTTTRKIKVLKMLKIFKKDRFKLFFGY